MTRRDDFLLTPDERQLRQRRRIRYAVIAALLGAFAVGAYLGVRPAVNAVRGWQARRHATKAYAAIEAEKWEDARASAIAAYQIRPAEPEALRAVARYLARTRQPEALEFFKRLRDADRLSRPDLRDEATIALLAGESQRATAAIGELTAADAQPADWLLATQLALQIGDGPGARAALEKIFADAAASPQERFQAAVLEMSAASLLGGDAAAHAFAELERLSADETSTGLAALVVLAQQTLGRPQGEPPPGTRGIGELSAALDAHPLAKTAHKLLAVDLQIRADPGRRDALIDEAITRWKDAADNADLAALAGWLNAKTEHQKLLGAIPIDRALQARELFLPYVDALAGLGRWSEVKRLLEGERFPLDPVMQLVYLARTNAQLGETTAAKNNWQRALETAGGDPSKLMAVAEYAEKNGLLDIAGSAYAEAVTNAPRLRPAHRGRLRIAQRRADTRAMAAALGDMLHQWPNDPAIQNDEAYVRLLLLPSAGNAPPTPTPSVTATPDESRASGTDEAAAIETLAEGLVERSPNSLPHRTTLALARLRQGRPADALKVFEGLQIPPQTLTPSVLAVHAAALAANGSLEDARTEAAQIAPGSLLPEERALIESLLPAAQN